MVAVNRTDLLTFQSSDRTSISVNHPEIPADNSNLVLRTIQILEEQTGVDEGVEVTIEKQIPPGSGLGGGSSNAATTLRTLNDEWQLDLSRNDLEAIGSELGSDVNFFLNGPAAICEGRGEQVRSISEFPELYVGLILPDLHCNTPEVYQVFDEGIDSTTERTTQPDDLDTFVKALQNGDIPKPYNALRKAAFQVEPDLKTLFDHLRQHSELPVEITGSGSGLFLYHREQQRVNDQIQRLRGHLPPYVKTDVCPLYKPESE